MIPIIIKTSKNTLMNFMEISIAKIKIFRIMEFGYFAIFCYSF